jgi:hypothetical protein
MLRCSDESGNELMTDLIGAATMLEVSNGESPAAARRAV